MIILVEDELISQDTFECEELNKIKVPDWGDSIFYAAYRSPNALEEATKKAFYFIKKWKS